MYDFFRLAWRKSGKNVVDYRVFSAKYYFKVLGKNEMCQN
jgi:hypothetical protein